MNGETKLSGSGKSAAQPMIHIGSLDCRYSARYCAQVTPRTSTLNFGFSASRLDFITCAMHWRVVLPLLKRTVNLNPFAQTCPPRASRKADSARFRSVVYHVWFG